MPLSVGRRMRRSPNRSNLRARLKKAPGEHGMLPAAPAFPVAADGDERRHDRQCDSQFRRSSEFLEFAQAAGGFGVADLNQPGGDIAGAALFFDLLALPSHGLSVTRE